MTERKAYNVYATEIVTDEDSGREELGWEWKGKTIAPTPAKAISQVRYRMIGAKTGYRHYAFGSIHYKFKACELFSEEDKKMFSLVKGR